MKIQTNIRFETNEYSNILYIRFSPSNNRVGAILKRAVELKQVFHYMIVKIYIHFIKKIKLI